MKIEEQKRINEVKEKMLVEQQEMQARNNAEKQDESHRSNLSLQESQQKVLEQADLIQKLQDAKRDLETLTKEQEQKISSQTHELQLIHGEITELRKTNKDLDGVKFSQEKSITEYHLKQESLKRELEDKVQTIGDLKSHLKSVQEAKDGLVTDLKASKASNEKLQKKIDYCKDQMEKGNEHI